MRDWAASNPHLATGLALSLIATLLGLVKFLFARHREFVGFTEHMRREETEVWPVVQETQRQMHAENQEAQERLRREMSQNHLEAMTLLREHSARIDSLEKHQPNGDILEIKQQLVQIIESLRRR